jgi:hypothetical protein
MKRFKRALLIFMLIWMPMMSIGSVLMPVPAHGATAEACGQSAGGFLSFPTWYKYLNPRFEDNQCKIDFTFPDDIGKVLLAGFEIVLRIASLIAIGFVLYGGFQYIISQGEPDKIKNAHTTLVNALVGLVITIFASAIVNLIARNIQ